MEKLALIQYCVAWWQEAQKYLQCRCIIVGRRNLITYTANDRWLVHHQVETCRLPFRDFVKVFEMARNTGGGRKMCTTAQCCTVLPGRYCTVQYLEGKWYCWKPVSQWQRRLDSRPARLERISLEPFSLREYCSIFWRATNIAPVPIMKKPVWWNTFLFLSLFKCLAMTHSVLGRQSRRWDGTEQYYQ